MSRLQEYLEMGRGYNTQQRSAKELINLLKTFDLNDDQLNEAMILIDELMCTVKDEAIYSATRPDGSPRHGW